MDWMSIRLIFFTIKYNRNILIKNEKRGLYYGKQ